MARRVLAAVLLFVAAPWIAEASDWGGIYPGETTLEQVRARYGQPSSTKRVKVEGYDTEEWLYEGNRVPTGLVRMTLEFGLLTPSGYQPSVVRLLKLEPRPLIFGRQTVIQGWGVPDNVGTQGDLTTFFYRDGLFAVFEKDEGPATILIFSPPQPVPAPGAKPAPAAVPAPTPSRPPLGAPSAPPTR